MADENRILSAPPGGTGDNMYEIAGAIDPREVGVDALNAGALSDEEFMMAEEFMNALPPEAQESFMDRLMNDPRATMRSVMDTLGQMFGGEPDAPMGALGRIGSGDALPPITDAELDEIRRQRMNMDLNQGTGSGDPMLDAIRSRRMDMNVSPDNGSGDPELDAIRRQRMSMDNR